MYNIWREVSKGNIILVIMGVILCIGSIIIDEKFDYSLLLITILLIIVLLYCIYKYLSLKKHGTIIKDLHYEIIKLESGAIAIVIEYQDKEGNPIKLYRYRNSLNKKEFDKYPKQGTTDVLINLDNPKRYFIFDPK